MSLKKLLWCFVCGLFIFTGCVSTSKETAPHIYTPDRSKTDVNPTVKETESESQKFIFNTESVGFTTITIRRSEWNKMLSYFDYFYKNENLVIAESYEYEKDGVSWTLNTVGLRLRGNTSRFRPQGKDYPVDENDNKKMNADWSVDYYNYAADCPDDDYRQSHFKIDFEPFEEDNRKMSDCLKGVALKRSDSLFSREMFCYNMFHQYGIWTAPYASQTKVYIKFVEDIEKNGKVKKDIQDCKITKIDFGVYEMFEEVNKQSLKSRKKGKNNSAQNAWLDNDGDLWKCSGGDLSSNSNVSSNFGCEDMMILNTDKPKSQWKYNFYSPCYDLKTNKASLVDSSVDFQLFIYELNKLESIDKSTSEGQMARKNFYEKWFDVDFFIKTYAVNMLLGMDDDYWNNANNYYLYFDNGKKGSGKCYLIPFDYDNSLGCSINTDKTVTDPFEWGCGNNRPLMDRLLEVPEYKEKMRTTLLEISSQVPDSPWNKDKCIATWKNWHKQVKPYVLTRDIQRWPNISSVDVWDDGAWGRNRYVTKEEDNLYEQVTDNFFEWLEKN